MKVVAVSGGKIFKAFVVLLDDGSIEFADGKTFSGFVNLVKTGVSMVPLSPSQLVEGFEY